ncbi:hypothetical protein [Intrasporangium flavum]|uniref:hypothetical protein n=1 Tax=Intrasporangium flavum TaxID=1428657 RepID=UPI00096ED430|nr:hypothetical protein [Intrasporangium flavum]
MTFEDLPERANEIPLTDPVVAGDVIDLIIGEADRAGGCLALMVCDSEHRGVQPVLVGEVPEDADPGGLVNLLHAVAPLLHESGGSVLIGRGRAHGTRATDADRAWHEAAIRTCRSAGLTLLGFHVATAEGVLRMPDPLRDAS